MGVAYALKDVLAVEEGTGEAVKLGLRAYLLSGGEGHDRVCSSSVVVGVGYAEVG